MKVKRSMKRFFVLVDIFGSFTRVCLIVIQPHKFLHGVHQFRNVYALFKVWLRHNRWVSPSCPDAFNPCRSLLTSVTQNAASKRPQILVSVRRVYSNLTLNDMMLYIIKGVNLPAPPGGSRCASEIKRQPSVAFTSIALFSGGSPNDLDASVKFEFPFPSAVSLRSKTKHINPCAFFESFMPCFNFNEFHFLSRFSSILIQLNLQETGKAIEF